MTLDRYFRTSSYCLFAISFLMLVATRQLDWISPFLYVAALMFGWEVDAGKSKWKISTTLTSWLMLIFLPFPFIDWLVLHTNPIVALVHFIFFASAMKLIQAKRDRDWIWLYVVSFFQMLLAAGMTATAWQSAAAQSNARRVVDADIFCIVNVTPRDATVACAVHH